MKTKWLDRRIAAPGPYLCLCLSVREFRAALKHLEFAGDPPFLSTAHASATCHHLNNPKGQLVSIVCMDGAAAKKRKVVEVYGLLIHEAVHVWQEYCDVIGERRPGVEQEAYAVQAIAQELIHEYMRRAGR